MRHKSLAFIVAVAVSVAGCAGGSAPSASPQASASLPASPAVSSSPSPAREPIKLGAIIPLTGPSAAVGQDMKEAYELARDQINAAGGVGGAPLEVIYEDDQNDPATAVASFEKLVNSDKVAVMIGGLASTVTAALIEPAKAAKVPMAWTGAASTKVEEGFAGQDWFFHYHPWEYQNAESALAFLKSLPYKTFAIAHEDGLFGTGAAQGFQQALPAQGQQVVATEAFKSGSTDFTALIERLKSSGADVLILVPFGADVIPFLTQMREVGWQPKLIYASPPSFPAGFGKSPVAEGVTGLTLWTPDIATEASKRFVADFQAKYGRLPVSYWAPLAYTNLVTVADALAKSGPGDVAGWIAAMAATKYDSPIGQELTFKPSKYIAHQGFTSLVSFQWQGGKQVIIYPPELATGTLK